MTNIPSKKCKTLTEQKIVYLGDGYVGIKEESYNNDNTIQNFKTNEYNELLEEIDELEKKLSIACKALDTIRKANNFSIKSKYGLLFASQYAGKVLDELKEVK